MSSRDKQQQQLAALEQKLVDIRNDAENLQQDIQNERDRNNDGNMGELASGMSPLGKSGVRQRRVLKGHTGKVTSVEWFMDSERLASVAQDGKLFVWDGPSGNKLQAIHLKSSWVMSLGISSSGKFVSCGGLDNIVSVYNLKDAEAQTAATVKGQAAQPNNPHRELTGHIGFISACKFIGDSQIISASGDHSCVLWDIDRGQQVTTFSGHTADVIGLALLTPNGQDSSTTNTFITASGDTTSRIWDIRSGQCEWIFEGHTRDLSCIDVFPDANAFITGSEDGTCRLFDIRADRQLQVYGPVSQDPKDNKPLTSVGFTHSGRGIFASYEDPNIRLWDTYTATCKTIINASDKDARVSRLAVSDNGNALATASWDFNLKVWA